MKRQFQILSIEVDAEEFQEISRGRQRYLILGDERADQLEPGDFIELIEKPDPQMPRKPDRYVVRITHVKEHYLGNARIFSLARVTDVALRLREASQIN